MLGHCSPPGGKVPKVTCRYYRTKAHGVKARQKNGHLDILEMAKVYQSLRPGRFPGLHIRRLGIPIPAETSAPANRPAAGCASIWSSPTTLGCQDHARPETGWYQGRSRRAQQQPQDRIDGSVRTRDLGSEGSRSACAGPDTPPAPAYTRPRFPDLVVHSEALFGRSAFSAYLAPRTN